MDDRQRRYYEANKDHYRRRNREHRDRARARLAELKSEPCADCGGSFPPYVMQFDHIGDDKVMDVSNMVCRRPWAEILAEVAKCDAVCANCHAIRTHTRHRERRVAVPPAPPTHPARVCKRCSTQVNLMPRRRLCRTCYNESQRDAMRRRRAADNYT